MNTEIMNPDALNHRRRVCDSVVKGELALEDMETVVEIIKEVHNHEAWGMPYSGDNTNRICGEIDLAVNDILSNKESLTQTTSNAIANTAGRCVGSVLRAINRNRQEQIEKALNDDRIPTMFKGQLKSIFTEYGVFATDIDLLKSGNPAPIESSGDSPPETSNDNPDSSNDGADGQNNSLADVSSSSESSDGSGGDGEEEIPF